MEKFPTHRSGILQSKSGGFSEGVKNIGKGVLYAAVGLLALGYLLPQFVPNICTIQSSTHASAANLLHTPTPSPAFAA